MTTTTQAPQEPPASPDTVAARRRRQQTSLILPPPPDNDEKYTSQSNAASYVATAGSPDTSTSHFAEAQQAGLNAITNLAKPDAPARSDSAGRASAPRAASRGPAASPVVVPVIELSTPVIDRPKTSLYSAQEPAGRASAMRAKAGRTRRPIRISHSVAHMRGLPLLCILAVQALLSLRLVWSNTAFQDEALYLWAGHLEIAHLLHGSTIPAFSTYFSGAPVIYPVVGAIADAYGGLALARLLSLAFMLASTALLYATTGRLFGRKAALGAASVFAVLGPVQVLGAFATFDAMSIFLLALSTWLVIRAQGRFSELLLLAAGLVMALADAAKYASALWNPVIIIVAVLTAGQGRLLRPTMRGARLAGYTFGALAIALFRLGGHAYIQGFLFTTFLRQAGGTTASAPAVFGDSFNWVGIVFVLAVIGLGVSFTESIQTRLLCSTLTTAILLAPAEQARIHILTSLHKHVAFGAWFAAIVAGYALAQATEVNKAQGWRVVAAAVGIAAFLGIPQATAIFRQWPNSSEMISDLAPAMAEARCPCLITENNVVNYYLLRQTIPDKLTGAFSYFYWDPHERRVLQGLPAYRQAIADHYFHVVEVDPDENPAIYGPVTSALAASSGWQLIHTISSGTTRKPFEIWRYYPPRSASGPRH